MLFVLQEKTKKELKHINATVYAGTGASEKTKKELKPYNMPQIK